MNYKNSGETQEKISTLSTMGIVSTDDILKYFPLKAGLDILCKLFTVETICMKCQILFSGKNKKNIVNWSSAELAQRVVEVKNGYLSQK